MILRNDVTLEFEKPPSYSPGRKSVHNGSPYIPRGQPHSLETVSCINPPKWLFEQTEFNFCRVQVPNRDPKKDTPKVEENSDEVIDYNLYVFPPSFSFRERFGTEALTAYLRCLYSKNVPTISVNVKKNEKMDVGKTDIFYLFEKVLASNQYYTIEPEITAPSQTDGEESDIYSDDFEPGDEKIYTLRIRSPSSGGSVRLGSWAGVVSGLFLVVASAFVPRF